MVTRANIESTYSVSEVASYLKELLASDLQLADVWIEGEISNLSRSTAGHCYFTLKDEKAQLRSVMFRSSNNNNGALENGAQVAAHGRISFYEVKGDLQFYVDYVHAAGVGVLYLEYERLKSQLETEGLFDETRKRSLPAFAQRIGVVTSATGAVFHDIRNVLDRRWPLAELVLAPTPVQGVEAPGGLVAALARLNAEPEIDVIIVARGGGSIEELWAFNDEAVARAIYASRVPVVTGVGHETDYTIADYVADKRAPTPSAAAEVVTPNRSEVLAAIRAYVTAMRSAADGWLGGKRALCEQLNHRLLRRGPEVERERQRLDDNMARAGRALLQGMDMRRHWLQALDGRLTTLNPRATLRRGYALVQNRKSGLVVTSELDVKGGDPLDIHVADGSFPVSVDKQYGF